MTTQQAQPAPAPPTDDPHLWLEDVTGERALSWVEAQNKRSLGVLENDEQRKLQARLLAIYDSKEIDAGIAYLKQYMPEIKFGQRYSHYFYGHYYAAQALWIRGGDDWNQWYPAIRDELGARQSPQGYWVDSIGNDYGTAMALIILQMPNNYLPIFQR